MMYQYHEIQTENEERLVNPACLNAWRAPKSTKKWHLFYQSVYGKSNKIVTSII